MYTPGNATINYVVERVVFEIIFHGSFNVVILHISLLFFTSNIKSSFQQRWLLWDACFNQYEYKI
jgi:hypothetical protein